MLKLRPVESKNFEDYRQFLDKDEYEKIKLLAKKLKGKKIVHINATPTGGGVVTILRGIIPLEQSLSVDSSWYTIDGAEEDFFVITKKIHNSLQSGGEILNEDERNRYLKTNQSLAKAMEKIPADLYFIHDPQPLTALHFSNKKNAQKVLRLHIDLSEPTQDTLSFLEPYIEEYGKVIFSLEDFVPQNFPKSKLLIIPPAIDPFDVINMPLSEEESRAIVSGFGIHCEKPLISQNSRFDPWKDPVGVIHAYYKAKNEIHDLQLVLANISEAADDPEAKSVFLEVKRHAKGDPDIFLFSEPEQVGYISSGLLTNAIQAQSDISLTKSIKEGFGLTVSEAMWKGRPVIGGNVGGIKKQIIDGESGFLVNSPDEAANRIVELMKDEKLRKRIGKAAHERVKKHFLITRHLRDHLEIYSEQLL